MSGMLTWNASLDGRFVGYGSSDLSIGMLDAKTLSVRGSLRFKFAVSLKQYFI